MRFTILITAAISVLAFVSQSASALPVQDSHREPSQLSKRQLGGLVPVGGGPSFLDSLLGLVTPPLVTPPPDAPPPDAPLGAAFDSPLSILPGANPGAVLAAGGIAGGGSALRGAGGFADGYAAAK
jgi:hypothetical protein